MPPDPVAKKLLLGTVLLCLTGKHVASQHGLESSYSEGTCKWPHNSTSPGHPTQQSCTCNSESQPAEDPEVAAPEQKWEYATQPVAGQFIVRFKDYKMAAEHKRALVEGLGDSKLWKYVDRNNAAARFPTDFALVEIDLDHVEELKGRIAALEPVKDVHPEQRVKRSLAWAPEEECERHSGSLCDVGPRSHINKRPGRFSTKPSQGLHDDADHSQQGSRRLLADRSSVVSKFGAELLWNEGFRGELVRMGVFDTGIRLDHPHVKHIRERTNWTHEPTLEDGLGHGTFVAGVIGGTDASCPGFAQEVELYTFRVFTNDQVSYTSWFLDAFNYAIGTEMNVVNLSIGGPDYLDLPFVEKVWEITSSGILMVSAIGNDGPLYGTLNNPADQNDVIGVGGIDYADKIASFSSRGMSTWELPRGYGRAKPDVVAYGRDVMGSRIQGGCRSLSGTSVASPVVAGAICLLASTVPVEKRWHFSGGILNPASMKQALVEGAVPIPGITMYEQGQGKLDLVRSKEILSNYEPRASIVPANLDFTQCPFMWPFCKQPIYAHAMPLMFNATVLNGMGLTGTFDGEPLYTPTNEGGKLLDVRFEHSDLLWPWSGFLALYVYVRSEGAAFNGTATGEASFTIVSPPMPGETEERRSLVKLPITVAIIPVPPRERRLLWDQFHSLRYPPAYLPRDSLDVRNDILDWHGDHPHTNYHEMYDRLRQEGYFLEVLGSPFTCFDASQYGALLVVDSEEEFYEEEVAKLHRDVEQHGLGLVVFADWYNVDTMVKMRFFDDNTRSWWTPITGGANIPAVNDMLKVFDISFGDALLEGQMSIADEKIYYASGVNIVRFPAGGNLLAYQLADKATAGMARTAGHYGTGSNSQQAVLGFTQHGEGRLAVYGDSNCLDSSHQRSSCFGLLIKSIQYVAEGKESPALFSKQHVLKQQLGSKDSILPLRRHDVDLTPFSTVLSQAMVCSPNAPLDFEQLVLPHRGATHSNRLPALKKIKDQPIVTNLVPLNGSEVIAQPQLGEKATAAGEATTLPAGTKAGRGEVAEAGRESASGGQGLTTGAVEAAGAGAKPTPTPAGLKRFTGEAAAGKEAGTGGAAGQASNEASSEDAALFGDDAEDAKVQSGGGRQGVELTGGWRKDPADAKSEEAAGKATIAQQKEVQRAQSVKEAAEKQEGKGVGGRAASVGEAGQGSRSHEDVIQQAEQRKEVTDVVKAAVIAESKRMEELPAWKGGADAQTDPRNRVGEEATKILEEKPRLAEVVLEQRIKPQEVMGHLQAEDAEPKMGDGLAKGGRQEANMAETGEGRARVEARRVGVGAEGAQKQGKATKYDSIDPLAEQPSNQAGNAVGSHKESKFLELSGEARAAAQQQSQEQAYAGNVKVQRITSDEPPIWKTVIVSLAGFPQGLVVVGVVGMFVLWHVRRRRRSQDAQPLRERGKSTRVVTLGMLGLGTDTSSMKSRQRQNFERSTTLGRPTESQSLS